jgi:hypothetical protein
MDVSGGLSPNMEITTIHGLAPEQHVHGKCWPFQDKFA